MADNNDEMYARGANGAAAGRMPVTASRDNSHRRGQLDLVRALTDESEPSESMRELADDYRRAVAEGRVTSS